MPLCWGVLLILTHSSLNAHQAHYEVNLQSLTRGISLLEHSVCGFCDLAAINISPMQLHSAVPSAPLLTHEVYKTRCPTMDMPGR